MTPLRVAFVDQVGRTAGGAERNLAIVLSHLPPSVEPIVILFEDGDFANELREANYIVEVITTAPALGRATRAAGSYSAARFTPRAIWHVMSILRARRIGLVYTNSMKAHIIGGLAAFIARLPCLIHFHDLYEGRALNLLRMVAKLVSHQRIACSKLVADVIGVGCTTVIYGPVDRALYEDLPSRTTACVRLGIQSDLPIIALIGRINRWKGHDRFLRIAAEVNKQVASRFLIVGAPIFRDADFLPELHALAEELELGDRIRFIPWLDDVRDVFAAITINANCSTREPFGRTIPEAAAAGVPTVCFSDSGAAETIVDDVTGRTIAPGDEAAFADAIVEYLRHPEKLLAASDEARRLSERFDAPGIAEATAVVIHRAAAPVAKEFADATA